MEKDIILLIAGFYIRLHFTPTEYTFLRDICVDQIKSVYKGFIVKDNLYPIDHIVVFKESAHHTYKVKKSTSLITVLSSSLARKKTVTYYYVGISLLSHILGSIITKLLARYGGFTLHASSCAVNNDECYVFLGPSGGGKSTAISLLAPRYKMIGDDRVLIKKENGAYYVYQSTFIPKDKRFLYSSKKYRIKKLLFLKKSNIYKLKPILDKEDLFALLLPQLLSEKKQTYKDLSQFAHEVKIGDYLFFGKNRKQLHKLLISEK